ncbi:hypothetical protein GCM10010436_02250 [Paractinoplanes durhamensis]
MSPRPHRQGKASGQGRCATIRRNCTAARPGVLLRSRAMPFDLTAFYDDHPKSARAAAAPWSRPSAG